MFGITVFSKSSKSSTAISNDSEALPMYSAFVLLTESALNMFSRTVQPDNETVPNIPRANNNLLFIFLINPLFCRFVNV